MKLLPAPHLAAAALLAFSPTIPAQQPGALVPDHRDVAYDDKDPAQKLDVYLAKSDDAGPKPVMVYLHGGGWRGGSKNTIPGFLAQGVKEGWLSVVSVEYRFTNVAPHPAQVNDCARAIQYARSRAKEWNLDPKRFGVTGGSAGGHLSSWIGLRDDMARPDSAEPVERESSRVSCVVNFAGPTDWALLDAIEHKHPAYRQLLGYEPGTPAGEMAAEKKADVSPVTFVSKDDPPSLLIYGDADDIVPIQHGRVLAEKLQAAGVSTELLVVPGGTHAVAGGAGEGVLQRSLKYVKEHLLGEKP